MSFGYGLQTTFNEPIGLNSCIDIRDLHFTDARIDIRKCQTEEIAKQCLDEVISAGLEPLTIIDARTARWAKGSVSVGNEPDINGITPDQYINEVNSICRLREDLLGDIYVGVISNLSLNGLGYFGNIWNKSPIHVKADVHRYAEGKTGAPQVPHHGFGSRSWINLFEHYPSEVGRLLDIIKGRDWIVSEFGYSDLYRSKESVVDAIKYEWELWASVGAKKAFLYQLNDGLLTSELDHYGIRDVKGIWKPSAFTVPNVDLNATN